MIIGISGNINSGKDTVASILVYLYAVGKHKATFRDWVVKKDAYYESYKHKITHFAEGLKDTLSQILWIPRDLFDNRLYKDELWYHPSTGKFIHEDDLKSNHVKYYDLDVKHNPFIDRYGVVKIRTLIQTYGEHMKKIFSDGVWVMNSIRKASYIESIYKVCIIPDVRFQLEADAIMANGGVVIKINRPNNEITSDHCSENNEIIGCQYVIENDGTLQNLFYKILAIYDK